MKKHTEISFTNAVKKVQEEHESREMYAKYESRIPAPSIIGPREQGLIERIDGFYMATVNADGWPYVQFRGGPKGFLKVIDDKTIGFADFKGNLQYISTGNLNETKKASLILLHYPTRTRLKIWAEAEIVSPKDNPELAKLLHSEDYGAVVERLLIFHVQSFDWNCPQHIPQRFTVEEFKEILPDHPEIIEDCCPDLIK